MKLQALLGLRSLRYGGATLLLAAVGACALVMNGRSGQAVSAPAAVPAPSLNGQHGANGPEALLSRTLREVGNRRLDAAVTELDKIIRDIQIGLTPVIIANGLDWVVPGARAVLRDALLQQVESGRQDWENRDIDPYLAHYAADFYAGRLNEGRA